MLEKYLQEIGLTYKEAKIYLALLEVDNASVLEISKKTLIKRPTVYVVLETLMKKGLVSETNLGKKVNFQAEPPERLQTYIERQKVLFDDKARLLKDYLPQIKSIQRDSGERPVVRFFDGKEGVISANEDIYEGKPDGSKMYLIYSRDQVTDVFSPEETKYFRDLRVKREISTKVIYTKKDGEMKPDPTAQRVKLDEKKYPFYCDVTVYKDKVRISILGKKLSGVFIKSKELADTIKSMVDYIHDHKPKT